jgi:hypothetical protein
LIGIEWKPIESAPKDRQVLLWFNSTESDLRHGRKKGKCRVGWWKESGLSRGDWWVFTAGGLLVMPQLPDFWAGIEVPSED